MSTVAWQDDRLRDLKSLQESNKNRTADQQGCRDVGHDPQAAGAHDHMLEFIELA